MRNLTPRQWRRVRRYVYRGLTAGGAVAVFYGVLNGAELAIWLGLANTLLGGLADANTGEPADDAPGRHEAP